MAINEMIPLQTRVAPLGNALLSGLQQGQAMRQAYDEKPIRNELLQQQKQRGAQQQFNDEQKSIIQGAAQIKPLLDAGDARGALAALQQRKQALQSVGLNTVQTDEAIAMLQSGDVAGLKSSVDSIYQSGLRSGVLQEPDLSKDYYRSKSLELQERRLDESAQDRAAMRSFQQQQLDAQRGNQSAMNDIRQQQLEIQRQASQAREDEAKTRRDAATEKKRIANSGLEQELIGLEGVLADINRAEKLLKGNKNLTGPIVGKTPSLSPDAQELESLTQALGIGALQQFKGATSEKELAAALRSGLSMTADAGPNMKRLAAQRAVVQRNIDRIRGIVGNNPAPAQQQGGPVQIQSDDDYNSLPSGAEFIAPDGSRRRKP